MIRASLVKWARSPFLMFLATSVLSASLSGYLAHAECPCQEGGKTASAAEAEPAKVDVGSSPSIGPADAKVTLIVFSDFECPFCARGAATVQEIINRYGDQVRVVFKHNPLPSHAYARLAAAAAEAAHAHGKFWKMHTLLFSHQTELDPLSLERYAQQLGLDLGAFRDSIASGQAELAIASDLQQAKELGIQGTPTFYVNGRVIRGAQPIDVFVKAIDSELNRAASAERRIP